VNTSAEIEHMVRLAFTNRADAEAARNEMRDVGYGVSFLPYDARDYGADDEVFGVACKMAPDTYDVPGEVARITARYGGYIPAVRSRH
jgi:hypothetical protein